MHVQCVIQASACRRREKPYTIVRAPYFKSTITDDCLDTTSSGDPTLEVACRSRHVVVIAQVSSSDNKSSAAHTVTDGAVSSRQC